MPCGLCLCCWSGQHPTKRNFSRASSWSQERAVEKESGQVVCTLFYSTHVCTTEGFWNNARQRTTLHATTIMFPQCNFCWKKKEKKKEKKEQFTFFPTPLLRMHFPWTAAFFRICTGSGSAAVKYRMNVHIYMYVCMCTSILTPLLHKLSNSVSGVRYGLSLQYSLCE